MDIMLLINWKYFIEIYNDINSKHLIAKNVLCSVCRSCLIKLSTSLLFWNDPYFYVWKKSWKNINISFFLKLHYAHLQKKWGQISRFPFFFEITLRSCAKKMKKKWKCRSNLPYNMPSKFSIHSSECGLWFSGRPFLPSRFVIHGT